MSRWRAPLRFSLASGLVLPLLVAAGASGASLRAEQITEVTAPDRWIGGPDAIGGVGDWYLANDVVEIVVDDPSRRHAKLNHGGTIVDAGLVDRRGEDQLARLIPLVNLDQRVFVNYDAIRAEVDPEGRSARLIVTSEGLEALPRGGRLARALDPRVPESGSLREVRVTTEYRVRPGEPFVHLTTTFRNDGSAPAPLFAYGDLWMRGGRSLRVFAGNLLSPERADGFHHRSFQRSLAGAARGMAAFTHLCLPGVRAFPAIGYALFSPERHAEGRPLFGVNGEHVSLALALPSEPDWQELGLLRVARAMRRELPPGGSWTFRRRLLVTGRADVASATDVIFPLLGFADGESGVAGRVEPASTPVAIHVATRDGRPVTQITPEVSGAEAGRYRAVLPPGDYALVLRAPHHSPRRLEVSVPAGAFARVPTQAFREVGRLRFEQPFRDGGPGRVVVRGLADTPDPVFGDELLDFQLDGRREGSGSETNALYFVGNSSDPREVAVRPGRYALTATRGFEFDAQTQLVEVPEAGAQVRVAPFELLRVAELEGWISADLHVHAQASDDSATPNLDRLRHFVAEDIALMVSTDHDHLADFGPALDALSLRQRIRVLPGVEVTSSTPNRVAPWTIGHHNAWPVPRRPTAHRGGAPPSQDLTVPQLYALLRRDFGAEIVQLNHARPSRDRVRHVAFLSHLRVAGEGFDPRRPLDAPPNSLLLVPGSDGTRPIDFDVMEVMNGASREKYRLLRRDWYALLRQGVRRTGTANSDTHGPDQLAGYPRNYVYTGDGPFEAGAFNDALRAGRSFGTTGPLFAEFQVNGARTGELASAPSGRVEVRFEVVAADWVPVDEVRLLVNGEVVRVFPGPGVERRVELALERDAFVTLEAGAPLDADPRTWVAAHPGLYTDVIAKEHLPTAFTNPIFVDVDGDGVPGAPGLPPAPPAAAGAAVLVLVGAAVALGLTGSCLGGLRRRARDRRRT